MDTPPSKRTKREEDIDRLLQDVPDFLSNRSPEFLRRLAEDTLDAEEDERLEMEERQRAQLLDADQEDAALLEMDEEDAEVADMLARIAGRHNERVAERFERKLREQEMRLDEIRH